jgi:hypothetical protein
VTVAVAPPSPFARLAGYWQGRGIIAHRGVCFLKLELRPGTEVNTFSGYFTITCTPIVQRIPLYAAGLNIVTPESAVLTGAADSDMISLHPATIIDSAGEGCPITSFTVRGFGARQIATEWKDGCHGGQLILQRVSQ